jgi:hypothetical protein
MEAVWCHNRQDYNLNRHRRETLKLNIRKLYFPNILYNVAGYSDTNLPRVGYPRQVIEVETLLRRLRFIWTALPTVITLITIIPLGTYNTSSWCILLRDDATPLVHLSSLMTAVCLSLLTRLLHGTASFTDWTASFPHCFLFYSGPFTDCCPFITLYSLHRGTTFNCSVVGSTHLIVPLPLLFVERFPRQRSVISVA